MSEQDRQDELRLELHRRLIIVTPELFSDFMYEKMGREITCLNCGSLDIGIPQVEVFADPLRSDHKNTVYISYAKIDISGSPSSLLNYEYLLICKNCGFTSHHAAYPVLNWIEGRESNNDE